MKRYLILVVMLLAAIVASAQTLPTISGNLTASTTDCSIGSGCVGMQLPDSSTVTVKVSGTFVGTLQFEASNDGGVTYDAIPGQPTATGAFVTSTTGTGKWIFSVASATHIRVRVSAYTSGTAVVAISAGKASFGAQAGATATVAGLNAAGTQQNILADVKGLNVHGSTGGFTCVVTVSTATTIQAVGGSCATPGAGLSLYITDIAFGTSAAAGTAADSFPTIKSGSGGTCGTATAVIWQALTTANSTIIENRSTPIKVAANSEICWIMTTAGSKTLQVSGFIAP